MKGLLDLARGKQPLLLDVDKLSYSSVLTSRNNAQIFIKDLEEESIRNIIKNKERGLKTLYLNGWRIMI